MTLAYTGIGSNIDPEANIYGGIAALRKEFTQLLCSPIYQSEPVGFTGPPFYNLVVRFVTDRSLAEVVATLRTTERCFSRKRGGGFGNRTLDLDLLLFDDLITRDPVVLPRPDIRKYAFVAKPLAELNPEGRHPELGVTFTDLWAAFPRGSESKLQRVELELGC